MSYDSLNLPMARYRLVAQATERLQLPDYTGSAWRGVLGHALKAVSCVTHKPQCEGCLLYRHCVYSYIFETPPPADTEVMRKYNAVPHPFVLIPDPEQATERHAGDRLSLDFVLFGTANQHLPYLVYAFEKAGALGLGKAKGRFKVNQLLHYQQTWQCIYQAGEGLQAVLPPKMPSIPECPQGEVRLHFHSPLRIRLQGRAQKSGDLDFYAVFSNLMRRISLLQQFHAEHPLVLDFKALSEKAKQVSVVSRALHWHDWTRYSSRQKTPMNMGGLMGSVSFNGSDLKEFWPILYLGQFTHAGKGTSMGLGRFTLEVPEV